MAVGCTPGWSFPATRLPLSGALAVRAALTWRLAKVTGIDYWGAACGQAMCERNGASEGAGSRHTFQHGDANRLDFSDGSFDAVVSNYVYHNITGADRQEVLLETLRVMKKGGVFALDDEIYGCSAEKIKNFVTVGVIHSCIAGTRHVFRDLG